MNEYQVQLKNPITNEIKTVTTGWSWTCFLFSWFYGVPLFLRGLNIWGGVMLFLALESYLIVFLFEGADQIVQHFTLTFWVITTLAFSIWFGIKANLMAIRNDLEKGWVFVDPNTASVKRVKGNLNMLD